VPRGGDDEGDAKEYGGSGERSRHAVSQHVARFVRTDAPLGDDTQRLAAANIEVKLPTPSGR
jgi:hypothetical protein